MAEKAIADLGRYFSSTSTKTPAAFLEPHFAAARNLALEKEGARMDTCTVNGETWQPKAGACLRCVGAGEVDKYTGLCWWHWQSWARPMKGEEAVGGKDRRQESRG